MPLWLLKLFVVGFVSSMVIIFVVWRYDTYMLDQRMDEATVQYHERNQRYREELRKHLADIRQIRGRLHTVLEEYVKKEE